jgi:hypothetical protein
MAKKSKEEIQQLRAGKKAEKRALARQFPGARLSYTDAAGRAVCIHLDEGEDCWLAVNQRGKWPPGNGYWDTTLGMPLTEIEPLGQLIRALICRYNALTDRANDTAQGCSLKPLAPIDTEVQ